MIFFLSSLCFFAGIFNEKLKNNKYLINIAVSTIIMDNNINQNHTSIEDLIWDGDFRRWVLTSNDELDEYWNNWIIMHQDRIEDVVAAKQIVMSMSVKETPVSDQEVDEAIQNIFSRIDRQPDAKVIAIHSKNTNWFKYAGVAAVLIVLTSVALLFINRYTNSGVNYKDLVKETGSELTEQVNNTSAEKLVVLTDGSRVRLQKDTKISFPSKFNDFSTRKVYLNGKATFEVAKNPEKPFFVYTNGIVTKVLGTRFIITSNEKDKNITVEVISGVVSVSSIPDKRSQNAVANKLNSLIIKRNQRADFSKEEKTLISSVVDQPATLDETMFNYAFEDEPIKKVFKNIVDSYGIEVIYDEKAFANRTFTADLSKTTMYQKLDIICKAINARYEILDGKIVIYTNSLLK